MFAAHPTRDRQCGNSLLLALVVMSALATLGGLTVVSVQSSLKTSTSERAQSIALYAAESGAAAMMEVLRQKFDPVTAWGHFVRQDNADVVAVSTADLPSNGALPGNANNPFSPDQNAWYSVSIYNNREDPHLGKPSGPGGPGPGGPGPGGANPPGPGPNPGGPDLGDHDGDGRVIIRSTGTGPQGSVAIVEWDVQRAPYEDGSQPDRFHPDPADPNKPEGPDVATQHNSAQWSSVDPKAPLIILSWHIVSM